MDIHVISPPMSGIELQQSFARNYFLFLFLESCCVVVTLVKRKEGASKDTHNMLQYVDVRRTRKPREPALTALDGRPCDFLLDHTMRGRTSLTIWDVSKNHQVRL